MVCRGASGHRDRATNDSSSIESVGWRRRRMDSAAMRLIRIDHVSLNAGDRARSLDWYDQVLGLRAGGPAGPPDQPLFLGPAGARVALFADRAPGLRHVAIATDGEGQRRVRERLERHRDHDSLYFRDPDGTMLEVMVPIA